MHVLDMSNNRANMAYVGSEPWHGLGTKMPANADMDEWRRQAGLDWTAEKTPVTFVTEEGAQTFDERAVLYRSDTKKPLSVVSDRYRIVQPGQIIEFYRGLCDKYDFEMETAGSLKDGKLVWALARTPQSLKLGNDEVNSYVLLATSYDGTMATIGKHTSVRVVCNNTLSAARAEGKNAISVSHSTDFDPATAELDLGLAENWMQFREDAERMAGKPVSPEQAVQYFMQVYHGMTAQQVHEAKPTTQKAVERTVKRLSEQYILGPGAALESAKNTVWGLLNAVTHDVDFSERARSDDSRLASAWFGAGEDRKAKAYDAALELIDA